MWQTNIKQQQIRLGGQRFTAADRDTLRQLAGTASDPALRDAYAFLEEWFSPSPWIEVQTSGSTGSPKRMQVEKTRMMHSAARTCEYLGLGADETALLCMNLKYIGAKMMVVRALLAGMRLQVRQPSGNPLAGFDEKIDFLAVVPLQLYHILRNEEEKRELAKVRHVIVGGGAVDEALLPLLAPLPCHVFSTYGMTETLSHIALRPLNGPAASERYTPFKGIGLSLSERQTLVIHAPDLCSNDLVTNDVARLYADGTFTIIGRAENTVNSGGIKIQIEEEEKRLKECIATPFALTSVADERLGEALVLLIDNHYPADDDTLMSDIKSRMPRYHAPRKIIRVEKVPQTENGKINRKACRELAMGAPESKERE